jgi:semaphorin 6
MVGGSRRQVLVLLTMTVGVSRGQEWLREQEPAHRTDYLNALEMETLGRNTGSEFETSSHSSVSSSGEGDSPTLSVFHEFHGNSSHTDHFKLLKEDGSSVLVGARNVIYNLSLPNLLEFTEERIDWSCSEEDKNNCDLKGKSDPECQNYIRVLSVIGPDRLLVCGTNCYSPLCRHYHYTEGQYRVEKEFSGRGYAPYDPTHNSTSLYTSGHLYAATVADFSGTDSLIIKDSLRTEQYDYKHLNAPDFVSSLEDEEHVYFFFREAAVEFMNCGKKVYSRVARVCKNDEGGSHKFRNRWTTFLKSRLNCSVPGDYPFYFNEIQSTTRFFHDPSDNRIFYGVFTTPRNAILGSAVCRFSVDDMESSFEGNFKNQESLTSNWLPMSSNQVPKPRPGRCYNQSTSLPESSLHFIKNHCLMDAPVQSRPSVPVFVKSGTSELFTKIALHQGAKNLAGVSFDVLFIGTNRGKVVKILVDPANPDLASSDLQEELQIFGPTVPILNLLIVNGETSDPKLIVLSADSVKSIPLASCHRQTCSDCLHKSSPYCAWDLAAAACVPHAQVADNSWLVQSVDQCPVLPEIVEETTTPVPEVESTTTEQTIEEELTTLAPITPKPSSTTSSPTISSTLVAPTVPSCPTCDCHCSLPDNLRIDADQADQSDESGVAFNLTSALVYTEVSDNSLEEIEADDQEAYTQLRQPKVYASSKSEEVGVAALMSQEQVVMIAVATGVASLVIGFLLGFFLSRVFCTGKSSRASVTSSTAHLMKPCPIEKPLNVDSGYTTPTLALAHPSTHHNNSSENNNKNINLMLTSSKPTGKAEKAKMTCTGTLQKVKRVYL